jgi:hypothetical protein
VARVEQLLREARRLAIDLEVDRDTLTEAWFVAAAFPPASRRPALPWATYLLLRFHPERHDPVDRAAAAGWNQARLQRELSARFAARQHRLTGVGGFLRLRGGDVNGDFVGVPASQLAVFPGTAHFFGLAKTELLLGAVLSFLDAPLPEGRP